MPQKETINILCATDENYAPYCGIVLTSLFASNKDCHFEVYVFMDNSLSDENIRKFGRLGNKYGNEIILRHIDESMVKGFPVNENTHITLPTYYRLLAAELLPNRIHKVLYLDCDLVVVGDIKPLWDVNLEGVAIAGVRGPSPSYADVCQYLGYSESFGYFNAGVLMYNLDYWRDYGVTEKIIKFVETHRDVLTMMDQDALNGVLYDEKALLSARFNYMTLFFQKKCWEKYTLDQQRYYLEEFDKVVVVHYAGKEKPWDYWNYRVPFFFQWEKMRRKSLWQNCINTKSCIKYAKHLVKRSVFPSLFRSQNSAWIVAPEIHNI